MEAWRTELYHHGILGMKWGVRRYQNPDGTYTAAGRKRYVSANGGSVAMKAAISTGNVNKSAKIKEARATKDQKFKEYTNALESKKQAVNEWDQEWKKLFNKYDDGKLNDDQIWDKISKTESYQKAQKKYLDACNYEAMKKKSFSEAQRLAEMKTTGEVVASSLGSVGGMLLGSAAVYFMLTKQ